MNKSLKDHPRFLKVKITFLFAMFIWLSGFSQQIDSVQVVDSAKVKHWNISVVTLLVFTPDMTFLLPVAYINYKRLHLEPRYNYESLETFSMFAGYNIGGGKKFTYFITPMLGAVMGRVNGIAPGLEADLGLGRFDFYTEMEYLFDLNDKHDSYYYVWSHFRYGITKWMAAGIAGGRNRVYRNDVDVQRGVSLGFTKGRFNVTGYYYNPFTPENYGSVSLFVQLN